MRLKKEKLICIFIISFIILLYGCNSDDDLNINNSKNNFTLVEKEFKEIINEEKFSKSLNTISRKLVNNSIQKTVMEDQYGFVIDETAPVKEIVNGGFTTYTLKINKDTIDNTKLNNLVVEVDSLNNINACIITYNLTNSIIESNYHNSFNLNYSSATIKKINYNSSQSQGKYSADCVTLDIVMCNNNGSGGYGDGHVAGAVCMGNGTHLYSSSVTSCSGGDDMDGGTLTSPTDSPHGGGGSTQTTFPDTPCGKLQKGTSSTAYNNNFKNINTTEKLNLPMEYGFVEKDNGYTYCQASGNEALKVPPGSKNFTHTHPNRPKTYDGITFDTNIKMPSPDDLFALITKCQRSNGANPTDAFGVMISDEGIFAITILEPFIFDNALQEKWGYFETQFKKKADKIISEHRENTQADKDMRKDKLQKMILSLLKGLGLKNKIGLFEGTVEQVDINVDRINWQKKSLDSSKNLIPEEC